MKKAQWNILGVGFLLTSFWLLYNATADLSIAGNMIEVPTICASYHLSSKIDILFSMIFFMLGIMFLMCACYESKNV